MTVSDEFADWVLSRRFADLPAEVIRAATEAVSDTVSLMVLGATTKRIAPFRELVGANPLGTAVIAGNGRRFRPRDAAFVNAIQAHSSELDDVFLQAGGHPGVATVPAALAVAQDVGAGGPALLLAATVGYEIMHRAINPIFPASQRRGFQGTGLAGPFGAAAAAATLRGADRDQIVNAFGIAGCSSCGLMEYDQSGGEAKRLYAGIAARAGVEAVDLAMSGVTGPPTIFEGKRGVYAAFADERDVARATVGLGNEYRILTKRHVKPYPVVTSIHGSLDALKRLVPTPLADDEIREIVLSVPPLSMSHGAAIDAPTDTLSAQFSFAFAVAVWLLTGTTDVGWFEDEAFRRSPRIAAMCAKVRVRPDPNLAPDAQQGGGSVEVLLRDGTVLRRSEPIPSGRPDNPLTPEQRRERFERFVRPGLDERTDELWRLLEDLPNLPSVEPVAELLASVMGGES